MPPSTTANSATKAQVRFSAARRSAQDIIVPAGAIPGRKRTQMPIVTMKASIISAPGTTPAMNMRPMSSRAKMQ